MRRAIQSINEMEDMGLKVYICTAPLLTSRFCVQEKFEWVRRYLGEKWLDKIIMCQDKSLVRGDILIDDKPFETLVPFGNHRNATWKVSILKL